MSSKSQTPFLYQLAAGAIAGTTEQCPEADNPVGFAVIDTKQLQRGDLAGKERYRSMMDCITKVVKTEGLAVLYRGIGAPILMEAPKRATKFAANDEWSKIFCRLYGSNSMTQTLSVLTGAAAGATEAFVVVPFELVKIRLQDRAQAHCYTSGFDCVTKIIRHEGFTAFFQGLESTVWRHVVWNAGYFGSVFQIRALMPPAESKGQKTRNDLIAGSVGGSIGTLLNTPLDVVKTRIQSTSRLEGTTAKYNWAWPALRTIYIEEGYRSLYKGLVPKLVRFCPGGGILLVVYTETLDLFIQASRSAY